MMCAWYDSPLFCHQSKRAKWVISSIVSISLLWLVINRSQSWIIWREWRSSGRKWMNELRWRKDLITQMTLDLSEMQLSKPLWCYKVGGCGVEVITELVVRYRKLIYGGHKCWIGIWRRNRWRRSMFRFIKFFFLFRKGIMRSFEVWLNMWLMKLLLDGLRKARKNSSDKSTPQ